MKFNNGTPHVYSRQEYICDLSRCTFYFDNHKLNENKIKATLRGKNILECRIKQKSHDVDVYITIPDSFNCIHYKMGAKTINFLSMNAHLTYHGRRKKKKLTGEIHIKNGDFNPFKAEADKTEAPIATSSDIETCPLPICRIELSSNVSEITIQNSIKNYFEVSSETCFFNTIEIHLARRNYMKDLASVSRKIPDIYSSLFVNASLKSFYLDKLGRRPGLFPQALALQTSDYELIILATHEYKNSSHNENSIHYFHTKDYLRNLGKRNVIECVGGWFIDQKSSLPPKPGAEQLANFHAPGNMFGKDTPT